MPYLQGRHDGRAAFLDVAIVDAARYKEHKESRQPVLRGLRRLRALIDTGATSTMVTRSVASFMHLEPTTKLLYRSNDGLIWRMAYIFHVIFYDKPLPLPGDSEEDGEPLVNKVHVCTRVITGGEIDDQPSFDVLLGMDIITTGDLTISRFGTFGFAFSD